MIPANRFPYLANKVPEVNPVPFIAEIVIAHGFEGLIGTTFRSKVQFILALEEGHWHVPASLSCKEYKKPLATDDFPHTTYHVELIDKVTGAKYWLGLQEWGDDFLLVFNVIKTKEGEYDETPKPIPPEPHCVPPPPPEFKIG